MRDLDLPPGRGRRRGHREVFAVALALLAGACGSDGGVAPDLSVASVVVTTAAPTFGAFGRTVQFVAEARNAAGITLTGHAFTWLSANTGVATVSTSGLVTAVAGGTTQVTASAAGKTSAGVTVTVAQAVATVTVTSAAGSTPDTLFSSARTRQFNAAAADSNGNAIATVSFTWTSAATGVATVDASTGLATSFTDGTAAIRATAGGITGSRNLVVRRLAKTLTVSPTSAAISTTFGTQVFTGTATDSADAALSITWTARPVGVASVAPTSGGSTTATGAGNGTTYVVITAGLRSDSAQLTASNQPAPVSFAGAVQPIFTTNCATSGCHTGANPQGGLNLSSGQAHGQLVNQAALGFPGATRVIPGNPEDSYLIRKLENRNIAGTQMPADGPPLDAATIQTIRNWIAQGALNN